LINTLLKKKLYIFGSIILLLSLSFYFLIKVGYAPDEGNHYTIVQHHAQSLTLSDINKWQFGTERGHAYYLFSPVPYVLHAITHRIGGSLPKPKFLNLSRRSVNYKHAYARTAGLIWSCIQYLLTLCICLYFFKSLNLALLITFGINLLPQLRYLHGYINADTYTILTSTLAFYVSLKVLDEQERSPLKYSVLVGVTSALVLHGKLTGFISFGMLAIIYLLNLYNQDIALSTKVRTLAIAILIPVYLAGWFHLWVFRELANGHILGVYDMFLLMNSTFKGTVSPVVDFSLFNILKLDIQFTWKSYWGWLVRHAELPNWYLISVFYYCLSGTGATLFFIIKYRFFGIIFRNDEVLKPKKSSFSPIELAFLFGPVVGLLTLLILSTKPGSGGIQGRLLLGTVVPFLLCVVFGMDNILKTLLGDQKGRYTGISLFMSLFLLGNILLLIQF